MLDFSSTLKTYQSEKEHSNANINLNDTSISGGLISVTSPVYLFCTSKNGINSKNENGWTPIYRSIIANNLVALNELLNLGSDPNISNNLGETPLYLCVDIDNYDALIILLQYSADTNISKRNGTTPLHLAAKKNKDKYMHALLRNKANPNLQNKLYSQTATHIAIINKINEDMLNIFHDYNADIYNIKDKYDKTPFDYAKELKDDEYLQLVIKTFGDKKDENNSEQFKTLNINKIPEKIKKNYDKILTIPQNLHSSNYNLSHENILIKQNGEKEINKIEIKLEGKIKSKGNKNIYSNNNLENGNNKKPENFGFISSVDALYSDRIISQSNETKNNILKNNINNLSEFQPITSTSDHMEIKPKNSLIKNLKNSFNIDTEMIDNSKDIILLNNDNNNLAEIKINTQNNKNLDKNKRQEKNNKLEIRQENIINFNFSYNENNNINNNIENNINGISESNEDNKIKNENYTDKEIIKNIISSTVKKIKVNTNTFYSEFSSLNNNSITHSYNNSNTKVEVLKLINFSSYSNTNKLNLNNKTNLDNYIISNNNLENGTSSFILYNSKNNERKQKNYSILTKNKISEITQISNNNIDDHIYMDNSNLFSEIQFNNCSNAQNNQNSNNNEANNNMAQAEEEISKSNKDLLIVNKEKKKLGIIDINNDINKKNEENNENVNKMLSNNLEYNMCDGSLEYSKSKSYIANEISLNNKNINNNNYYPLLNQHHRQISYHNNKPSINKRKKEEENQNEESINKENDNPNNNEIIYYNKNYLVGNNSTKKEVNDRICSKTTVIQKIIQDKTSTQSELNNMNIQRYNSFTNKTNSINQKLLTYTSPNINKINHLINDNINNNDKENIDVNFRKLNNIILSTNPNINISNLNETKEDFFSNNNNNLSSFLDTHRLESIKDSKNQLLIDNNNNSTFNAYDDAVEIKNSEKKSNFYAEVQNKEISKLNKNNEDKNVSKNDSKIKNFYRGSSMGNTTASSLTKNIINPGKQSISSTLNNNINLSNMLLTGRNSNTNFYMNQSNQSNILIKNIPINMLLRLRDWLISCDLLCYYNLLIENHMYDIDKFINELQSNKLIIGYKEIEDLGIRKPGHIFRLLLKLEIDSGILDNNLFSYILSKFNISSSISNNIILTTSIIDINCCGICNKNKVFQSNVKKNNFPYNDILSFLKYKELWKYKENFIHNGFDQLEYVLLQLFSKYTFDKEVMNDCFHLYNEKDKIDVLNKLYQEKRILSIEYGIEIDDNELNNILSNISYSTKYSSKEKRNAINGNIPYSNSDNNFCIIF